MYDRLPESHRFNRDPEGIRAFGDPPSGTNDRRGARVRPNRAPIGQEHGTGCSTPSSPAPKALSKHRREADRPAPHRELAQVHSQMPGQE